jgi:hypothetical protein
VANYSKGLPHDEVGEVDRDAYVKLLKAWFDELNNRRGVAFRLGGRHS